MNKPTLTAATLAAGLLFLSILADVTETKATEPKATETKATETKATEPKATEPKATEPKATEPKVTEPKVTEPKVTEPKVTEPKATEPKATEQCGTASWYALTSKTASGEYANPAKMTAAHKKLKFGTKVRVKNMRNGKSVILRINDRGPFIKGRIIDVTKAAAGKLGFINAGITRVCFTIIK